MNNLCDNCNTPLILDGYSGSPEDVQEIYICPKCESKYESDYTEEDENNEIDKQLAGKWEK